MVRPYYSPRPEHQCKPPYVSHTGAEVASGPAKPGYGFQFPVAEMVVSSSTVLTPAWEHSRTRGPLRAPSLEWFYSPPWEEAREDAPDYSRDDSGATVAPRHAARAAGRKGSSCPYFGVIPRLQGIAWM